MLSPTRMSLLALLTWLAASPALWAESESGEPTAPERRLPVDMAQTLSAEITIKGQNVAYNVTTGMQPVYGKDNTVIASLHYTYYERAGIDDVSLRPLMISFNGGPGSASLWMHLGYTSPKLLNIHDQGYPVQPYGVRDNEHSILDVADIVYVNPVNTGFSRIVDEEVDREVFFGVKADIEYLADWIDLFVSRNQRWTSPKYLIGESYGTTRVAGLAGALQNRHWMYLNGVILVSPTGLGLEPEGPAPRSIALKLPYYTATAWYHEKLEPKLQQRELESLLTEVEAFALDEYLPALARGGSLNDERKRAMAQQVARYAGLSEHTVVNHNLAVPATYFWKDLLRDEGYTVGRLDSRYRGVDRSVAGERPDYWAELTAWNHAFTPAINHYLRDELGFETDLQYYVFGPVRPWADMDHNAGEDLRQAMAQNPFLHVMVQSGYFDGATDYFTGKYILWHMDPSGRLADRMRFEGYHSGHMMYLRQADLGPSNEHIREFIADSMPANGQPARYDPQAPNRQR
jgi:carboxypeptidase C (cathepsin A)